MSCDPYETMTAVDDSKPNSGGQYKRQHLDLSRAGICGVINCTNLTCEDGSDCLSRRRSLRNETLLSIPSCGEESVLLRKISAVFLPVGPEVVTKCGRQGTLPGSKIHIKSK